MSRRDSRDHHSKRPSRFDRGPSPKKVRRDGQPTTERTYSRGRDLDADSAVDRDQKHSRRLLDSSPLEVAPLLEKPVQPGTGKKDLDKKVDEPDGMKRASYKKEDLRSRGEKEAPRSRDEKEVPRSRDGKEVSRFRDEKEVPRPQNEKEVPQPRDGKEVPRPRDGKEVPRPRDEKEIPRFRDEKEVPRPRNEKEVPRSRDGKEVPRPRDEKEVSRPRNEKEVPQLQTYFQHAERDSAGHDGRRSGRTALDHGRWSDSKEQYTDRARFKGESRELQRKEERTLSNADDKRVWKHDNCVDHGRWSDSKEQYSDRARFKGEARELQRKEERTLSNADNKVWKHDKFSELEAEVTPLRKRPAFSEKKMPAEPETGAAVKVSESTRTPHEIGVEGTRREERGPYHSRGLDKTDRLFSRVDERNGRRGDGHPQRAEMARPSYQQRDRFHGGFTSGRDMPNGGYNVRSAYRPGGVQVDKWKHDLYAEANRSPTPKNEEDQIAKVEALLAL